METLSAKHLNRYLFNWSLSEIRHGQLWPVSIALTLIIASIFALSALTTRIEQVIVKQGKQALTADTVFSSSNPIPTELDSLIANADVEYSKLVRFSTMAFSDSAMKLITVKAVDSRYPLQGELRLSTGAEDYTQVSPSELWLDERLFSLLEVNVGDQLAVGDAEFTISGKVVEEPGLSFNPFQQMPSVYIHSSDLEKTGAVQLGSRVRYNLFINGSDADLRSIKEGIDLTPSDRWRDENSASRTNEVFQRSQQYLSLTVAIVVIMAATTLVLTCQHYVTTRRKSIAMLKSLGATKVWLVRWLTIQISILLVIATLFGFLFGIGLEFLLRIPLVDLLPSPLPSYGVAPFIIALTTSVLIAIPALGIPFSHVLNISAANVMQPQSIESSKSSWWLVFVPIFPMLWVYKDNVLVWIVLAGMVALFVILGILSIVVTKALGKLPLNVAFKLALSRINRSLLSTGVQFGALSLSLMLLAIMWMVRTDLLSDWQRTLPQDAPNAFALNIAPYEKQSYLDLLDGQEIERSDAYPIIRGRLAKINQQQASEYANGGNGNDALRREINFTFAEAIPTYNSLVTGHWQGNGSVSVEREVAEDLGLKIGDQLEFVINGQTVSAEVDSIRFVEWRDMKPNFYFIFSPDVLSQIPATYLVSFRVEHRHDELLQQLSRQHPTVSLMDLRDMGAKIQKLVKQIVWALTLLAALGVIAGIVLIFTLLRLSLSQRQSEIQLYRTLGASKKRVLNTIWAEFGLMAFVAGIIAMIGAESVVALIMHYGFELESNLHLSLWILIPIATFCTLGLVVYSYTKRMLIPINKELT